MKCAHVPHDGRGLRAQLRRESTRIRLFEPVSAGAWSNSVLVQRALTDAGDEAFPDPRRPAALQPRGTWLPVVEVANDRYGFRIGCPDRENRAQDAVQVDWMSA